MAENETLDLGGRRWRHARAALANTDLSLAEIAKRIGDGLRSDVQSRLAKAFRSGQTLLMVTQAVGQNSVALRAAVESFQDGRLARIARDAAKLVKENEPASIASCATDMLIDSLMSRVQVVAGKNARFQDDHQRKELMNAVRSEIDARRSGIAAVIEESLRGQPLRQWRRKRIEGSQTQVDASILAHRSLIIQMKGTNHAQQQR